MNIHYRIVRVDTAAHGVVIRYWTDKVTEMDLASQFDSNGNPVLNADGYPVQTRTDSLMTIYEVPPPSVEDIIKRIKVQAPVDWLRLQESILDPGIDTRLSDVKNAIGDSGSYSETDIDGIRNELNLKVLANNSTSSTSQVASIEQAYDVINTITDSLKMITQADPNGASELSNTLHTIIS